MVAGLKIECLLMMLSKKKGYRQAQKPKQSYKI